MSTTTNAFIPRLSITASAINEKKIYVRFNRLNEEYFNEVYFQVNKSKLPTLLRQDKKSALSNIYTAASHLLNTTHYMQTADEKEAVERAEKALLDACSHLAYEATLAPHKHASMVASANSSLQVNFSIANTEPHLIDISTAFQIDKMFYDAPSNSYYLPIFVTFSDCNHFVNSSTPFTHSLVYHLVIKNASYSTLDNFSHFFLNNHKNYRAVHGSNSCFSCLDFGISDDDFKNLILANLNGIVYHKILAYASELPPYSYPIHYNKKDTDFILSSKLFNLALQKLQSSPAA